MKGFWPGGFAIVAALAGCEQTASVQSVPRARDPNLKTLAVLPFVNRTGSNQAGDMVAYSVAAGLRNQLNYNVLGPDEVRAELKAAAVPMADRLPPERLADAVRENDIADVYVSGVVTGEQYMYVEKPQDRAAGSSVNYFLGTVWSTEPRIIVRSNKTGRGTNPAWDYPFEWGYYGPPGMLGWAPPYGNESLLDTTAAPKVAVAASVVRTSDNVVLYNSSPPPGVAYVEPGRLLLGLPSRDPVNQIVGDIARTLKGR